MALSKEVNKLNKALDEEQKLRKHEVQRASNAAKEAIEEATAKQLVVVDNLRENLIAATRELHEWRNETGPSSRASPSPSRGVTLRMEPPRSLRARTRPR